MFGHTYIGDRFGHRCLDLTNYTAGPCSFSDLSECTAAQLAVNEFQSNYRQYMEGGSLYYMEEFDHYCGPNALDAYRDDYENYLARTGDYPPRTRAGTTRSRSTARSRRTPITRACRRTRARTST